MKRARSPGEIGGAGNIHRLSLREERCDRSRLARSHLDHQVGACADDPRCVRSECAIGPQAVRPAVERERWIMIAHLGRELRHLAARHIGRIRHHQIETVGAELRSQMAFLNPVVVRAGEAQAAASGSGSKS